MAKLADALDLGSSGEIRGGSSPLSRTKEFSATKTPFLFKSLYSSLMQNLVKICKNAAKANIVPGIILQTFALSLVLGYYYVPAINTFFEQISEIKKQYGYTFSAISTGFFGGVLPFFILYKTKQIPKGFIKTQFFSFTYFSGHIRAWKLTSSIDVRRGFLAMIIHLQPWQAKLPLTNLSTALFSQCQFQPSFTSGKTVIFLNSNSNKNSLKSFSQ